MSWNWPLAVVIVALLFFAYCAYASRETSRSVDHILDDSLTAQHCYSAGYEAGASGDRVRPTDQSGECARWFDAGFSDGQRVFDAYSR